MKQVGIDRDCIEFRMKRAEEQRVHRVRNWFFTPRGAFVYFGIGYAALASLLVWGLA